MSLGHLIIDFLKSDNESIKIPMTPIGDVESILNELGYTDDLDLDGGETNGWQVDFWYKFTSPGQITLTLSGSLHYGDFKLTKSPEEFKRINTIPEIEIYPYADEKFHELMEKVDQVLGETRNEDGYHLEPLPDEVPLILEPEDMTEDKWKFVCELFTATKHSITQRVVISQKGVEYFISDEPLTYLN